MDTGRQVIRWALPGWVTYLFLIIFMSTNFLLPGELHEIYSRILLALPELTLALGVASVPLGFMIYQFYHWAYWYFPMPAFGSKKLFDPIDRGRIILSSIEGKFDITSLYKYSLITADETPFKKWRGPIKFKSIDVMNAYRQNWHLSDSLWYLALTDPRYKDTSDYLERRNQMLGDIYHSLGACYQAVGIALVFYLLIFLYVSFKEIDFFISNNPIWTWDSFKMFIIGVSSRLLLVSANIVITYFMIKIFKTGRRTSFEALLALKHDVITHVMLSDSFKRNVQVDISTNGME